MAEPPLEVSRRTVMKGSGTALASLYAANPAAALAEAPGSEAGGDPRHVALRLKVNGRVEKLVADSRLTLLDALRDHLGLTGTKKGCDHGQCGACTVHVDGKRVLSCLTLAAQADRHDVTTIEGLSRPGQTLHPMQAAFLEHDAFQCGFCTSGQIMSAIACIEEGHAGSPADISEYMSGNICRCGATPHIVAAIGAVARQKSAVRKHRS